MYASTTPYAQTWAASIAARRDGSVLLNVNCVCELVGTRRDDPICLLYV